MSIVSTSRRGVFVCLAVAVVSVACSGSSDDKESSSGGASSSSSGGGGSSSGGGGTSSGGGGGGGGGSCTGDIGGCTMGSLSTAQYTESCTLVLGSIDDPAGTKYECKSGTHAGQFMTVNSKEQCTSGKPPATCKITVQQLIDCYKAVRKDACAAFGDGGACAPVFDQNNGCT